MKFSYSITICIVSIQLTVRLSDFLSDVDGASDENKKDFLGEAQLLSQFNHPNVLSLLGVVTTDDPVLIITPYMKNGDLHSFLTR